MSSILLIVGVVVYIITEVLKETPVPTEKPKLVVLILSVGLVLGNALISGQLTQNNVPAIVIAVTTVYASAVATYETVKTFLSRK